jgi:hypothetical protein
LIILSARFRSPRRGKENAQSATEAKEKNKMGQSSTWDAFAIVSILALSCGKLARKSEQPDWLSSRAPATAESLD